MNFYKTKKWRNKREKILRRDEYMCKECRRYGKTIPATTVHHTHPLEHYPKLALVSANLISLCGECHDSFHDRTTHQLTIAGGRWKEKVAPLLQRSGFNV